MKNESSIVLVAQSVTYRSANDERAFFEWLERVDGFENVRGIGRELHIRIRASIDEHGLGDLIALFFRYGVDLAQIPGALSVQRHAWLLNQRAYWFSAMFPDVVARVAPGSDDLRPPSRRSE